MAMTPEEREASKQRFKEKSERLSSIIKPRPKTVYTADFHLTDLDFMLSSLESATSEPVVMNPDFQRGHVWSPDQQRRYIENLLRNAVTGPGLVLQFNAPYYTRWERDADVSHPTECIDGLQRFTAAKAWMAGEILPFGLSLQDLRGSEFNPNQYCFHVEVYEFNRRSDLLLHYLDLNAGGTPHSEEEIQRVRGLFKEALANEVETASNNQYGQK